ncbi:hypothetical protein H072_6920 [Dactylellina haptotyla CBS 200.50]|uniref:FAD-binding PCMH-type domain-containing protein n=1 Tax=Dactylellina haptotyla (strain CBS 200.50) TaxID=1284197 RepID=S8BIX0_DACHA|nr:hypothetical protein H072_6920 [Dactylellina haptotyla CBS 200.50]
MVHNILLLGLMPLLVRASPLPIYHNYPPQSTINDCLQAADVPAILQSSASFDALSQPLNSRLKSKPAVITIPTTALHVSSAVKCAAQFKLKVTPRGGGHSYNAQSLGDGAVVIDMQQFHDVVYDSKTQLARIGGGARLGNVAQKLYDQGKRAMPHGTCPDVGIGGHSAGGFGWTSRQWGITVDHIDEVEVVTADGSIRRANKDQNSDLFWALRGAAPSFGVITNFWFSTLEAPDSNVIYSYKFTGLSLDEISTALLEVQKFGQTAPKEVGMLIQILDNGSGFRLYGTYYNTTRQQFDNLFGQLLQRLPSPGNSAEVSVKGWIDSLIFASGGSKGLTVPELGGTNQHSSFYTKSLMTAQDYPLTLDSIKSVFKYAMNQGRAATERGLPWMVFISLLGGRYSTLPTPSAASDNSFYGRNTLWAFSFTAYLGNVTEQSNRDSIYFLNGFDTSVRRSVDTAYINGHDTEYSREEAHRLYYGDKYQRLSVLKKQWDPEQVFWYPQSIDPAN